MLPLATGEALFIADNLELLAGLDEGEHTNYDELVRVAKYVREFAEKEVPASLLEPSWGFLKRGVTSESDRAAIATLETLRDEVDDPEYEDRSEGEALDWALRLVAHLRKDREMEEIRDIELDREERLAEEAGEALIVDPDHPDHPVQETLRERLGQEPAAEEES